jgi:hypothetical protein
MEAFLAANIPLLIPILVSSIIDDPKNPNVATLLLEIMSTYLSMFNATWPTALSTSFVKWSPNN